MIGYLICDMSVTDQFIVRFYKNARLYLLLIV